MQGECWRPVRESNPCRRRERDAIFLLKKLLVVQNPVWLAKRTRVSAREQLGKHGKLPRSPSVVSLICVNAKFLPVYGTPSDAQ
jgi:hypothetical protein